jgi:hypothetical protein
MPVLPILRRQNREGRKLDTSLGYLGRPCLKKKKKRGKKEEERKE